MTTPEENADIIGAMSRDQMVGALAILSARHTETFADCVAWAMESDARYAQYKARKDAEVSA